MVNNNQRFQGCCPLTPIPKPPKQRCFCPPGPRGQQGPQGPPGPGQYFGTQLTATIPLTVPCPSTTPVITLIIPAAPIGTQIKVDSMAEVEVRFNVDPLDDFFDYEITYELRRNGDPTGAILTLREKKGHPDFFNPAIETFVPNLTFTDTATGLPITYEIFICGQTGPNVNGQLVGGSVNYRVLNAIVFG